MKAKRKKPPRKEELYWADIGYAVFGLTVFRGRVVFAPPIARWMIGKEWLQVQKWINEKGIWEKIA